MPSFFTNKVVAITGGTDWNRQGPGRCYDTIRRQSRHLRGRHHDKLYNLQLEYTSVLLHTVDGDVSKEQDCQRFI